MCSTYTSHFPHQFFFFYIFALGNLKYASCTTRSSGMLLTLEQPAGKTWSPQVAPLDTRTTWSLTCKLHGQCKLLSEHVQDLLHPLPPCVCEAPQDWSPYKHCSGPQRERFEDVCALSHTSVQIHLHLLSNSRYHFRECVNLEGGRGGEGMGQ